MWNRVGSSDSEVVFIFAGTFTRSFLGFRRGGLSKLPDVGDTIVLAGREPITFKPGERASEAGAPIHLRVTEIDEADDWLKGVWTYTHAYSAAANRGAPWAARVQGCCRCNKARCRGAAGSTKLDQQAGAPVRGEGDSTRREEVWHLYSHWCCTGTIS